MVNNTGVSYLTEKTLGARNRRLIFSLYFLTPFQNTDNIWYGVIYKKNISNRMVAAAKKAKYKSFLDKSLKDFGSYDFQNVKYFGKLIYSDDRDGFIKAFKEAEVDTIESQIVLVPKTNNFNNRLGNTVTWLFVSFGLVALVVLVIIMTLKIKTS